MHFEAERTIDAPIETVWNELTAGRFTEWQSGILEFSGNIRPGERIALRSEADPKRTFKLKVIRFTPPRQMVWKSGMPFGLFSGQRTFTLRETGDATTFHVREEFSGPLARLITKSIPDLNPSMDKFAEGLKQQVERSRA